MIYLSKIHGIMQRDAPKGIQGINKSFFKSWGILKDDLTKGLFGPT
jgi:hypothetical protein